MRQFCCLILSLFCYVNAEHFLWLKARPKTFWLKLQRDAHCTVSPFTNRKPHYQHEILKKIWSHQIFWNCCGQLQHHQNWWLRVSRIPCLFRVYNFWLHARLTFLMRSSPPPDLHKLLLVWYTKAHSIETTSKNDCNNNSS